MPQNWISFTHVKLFTKNSVVHMKDFHAQLETKYKAYAFHVKLVETSHSCQQVNMAIYEYVLHNSDDCQVH